MRSMSLPALPLGGGNSLDRSALNPVARGQPRPVRGRRAQPQAAAPWPPTAWAGLPTVALQRGARPPNPPQRFALPIFFLIASKPETARRPFFLGDRWPVPVREGAQGAQPWGSGGSMPHVEERPRRGL